MDILLHIDWKQVLDHAARLLIAFFLTLPIGWDRERSSRHFGLRTFPLVGVVTCGFMLVGTSVFHNNEAQARVMQGIITGIGFIGGGTILTHEDKIKGTASAASIWNTGCIGISVAHGRFEIAIVLSLLNFLILEVFRRVKRKEGSLG